LYSMMVMEPFSMETTLVFKMVYPLTNNPHHIPQPL
jgi:hypothetical protein